jgi:hypothetical protein
MDICGEGLNIRRSHLMRLAQTGGLDVRWAGQRLDDMLGVVDQWSRWAAEFEIRKATATALEREAQKQRALLMR